jgi:TatD DNase family protein
VQSYPSNFTQRSLRSSIIDTHCHVVKEYFSDDQDEVIERAVSQGVSCLINPGVSLADAEEVLALTQKHPHLFGAVGVHPHEAKTWNNESEGILRQYAAEPKFVGIGECGLDYFYNNSEPEVQRRVFENQIRIASQLDKPLIVHCRDAWDECFTLIENAGEGKVRGVFHCFTGGPEHLERVNALGFYLSFSGIVTFPKSKNIQQAAEQAPIDKILVETDCPYLAPQPVRGRRNEPAYVWMVAEKLAELRKDSVESISARCLENAENLFALKAAALL